MLSGGRAAGAEPLLPVADFAANDRFYPGTFDHAAEKASDSDSNRSRVATSARQRIPAERPHPKATNWRCRPV